jgi:hypothetical protein
VHEHRPTPDSLPEFNSNHQPFTLCEPTKYNKADISKLFGHWKSRQEKGISPIVWISTSDSDKPLERKAKVNVLFDFYLENCHL